MKLKITLILLYLFLLANFAGAFQIIGGATGSGTGDIVSTNNLSDLASPATARTNLGLGTSDNPSFNSVHATGGNLAAANVQVVKQWLTGMTYTADNTAVVHGGVIYVCIAPHLSASETEPGVGASSGAAWEAVGSVIETDPVFTAWDKDYADLINPPAIPTVNTLATSTLSCVEGEIAKLVSGVWTCAADSEGTGTDDQTATEVSFTPTATRPETNTQAAIEGLDGEINDFPFLEFDATQFIEDDTTTPGTNKVSIDPSILGGGTGITHTTSVTPTDGACTWNTTDFKLRCRTGATVYASAAMTLEATLDLIAPTIAPAFLADGTLALNATDNEVGALTADCTKFTANCTTAGPITFTGTGPCTASPSVYSGDTCSGADAGGTVVDAAGNPSAALSFASVDNTVNATTASVSFYETFEASPGYDNDTSSWTITGTVDPDFNTTPNDDFESLTLSFGSSIVIPLPSSDLTTYLSFSLNCPTLDNVNSTYILSLLDSLNATVAGIDIRSTNYFRFYHSSGTIYRETTYFSAGVKTYVWLTHIPATDGVGGTLNINLNSTNDYSTSTALSPLTTGTSNNAATKLKLNHTTNNLGTPPIFDNIKVQYVPFN